MAGASEDRLRPRDFHYLLSVLYFYYVARVLCMAPKLAHLLDSSCYSATYSPTTEDSDTNIHSPSGSTMSQQHSSPFSELPPYYPGSQRTLSLDEHNGIGSTQNSEPQSMGSNYFLTAPLPPYYPMPLTNNQGIDQPNVDLANQSQQLPLPRHFPPHFTDAIFSTPIKQRLGTARPSNEQSKITVDKLAQLLHKELEDKRVSGPDFISLIFPDQDLPIPIDDKFFKTLESAKVWDKKKQKFFFEAASYSENDIANWLNNIVAKIAKCFPSLKVNRVWYAGNKSTAPQGSTILRKPDIILLNKQEVNKLHSLQEKTQWAMILALGETTAQAQRPQRMLDTVDGKSYILFTSQHDRRFVPVLSFDGSNNWSLTITGRQGQLFSGMMSLRGARYVGHFLRVLISLVFGKEKLLGLDPNMICDKRHHISSILVNGISYSTRRNIYSLQSLLGRGTKVWIVSMGHNNYILKDAWVQASRVENENKHLEKIKSIPGLKGKVPTLVAGEDVLIDGLPDNTLWYRVGLGQDDDHRVHRRVLTSDIGTSITTFTSKAEFIKAMIEVVHSTSGDNIIRC